MWMRHATALAAAMILSAPAIAQCNSGCTAGAVGTGGMASGGSANGFRYVGPGPLFPDRTLTNDGLASAGHVEVLDADGNLMGVLNGRCEPGSYLWHGTGSGIFGDWTGSSDQVFLPCD